MAHQLAEVAHGIDGHAGHEGRFRGIIGGHKDMLQPFGAGQGGQRQDALGVAGGAVQRQLADEDGLFQFVGPNLAGGSQHADGNGQVVSRAFLAQIGRGQIDGQAVVGGEAQAAVLDGGIDAVAALANGRIGQADQREVRRAADNIDFDFDQFGIQTNDGATENLGEHDDSKYSIALVAYRYTCTRQRVDRKQAPPQRAGQRLSD